MALFQLDQQQLEEISTQLSGLNGAVNKLAEAVSPVDSSAHQAIAELSTNLAKWQAQQTAAIQSGFASLIAALTGADISEVQQRINTLAESVKTEADALEQAAQRNQQSNEGD